MGKYDHVTPGQPFKPPAEVWNAFLDVAAGQRRGRFHTGAEVEADLFGQTIVDADDATGLALERFQAVGLNAPPVLPSDAGGVDGFVAGLRFTASVPALATHRSKWGLIAQTPCLSGATIQVIIAGLALAQVTINSTSHPYATLTDGDRTKLNSAFVGCAEILWAAGTSGLQWCVLRLQALQSVPIIGKPATTLPRGSTGTLNLWTKASGTWAQAAGTAAAAETVEALTDLPTDELAVAHWLDNRWVATACEPRVSRFRLTADLSTGGNAAAVLLSFDGTNYVAGAACYVFDSYALTGAPGSTRGMWQGKTEMEGIGLRREVPVVPGRIEFDIVWMETYAWECEVTLTANPTFSGSAYTSAWSATATVNKSFHQGISPGSTITVYDDHNGSPVYPFAKSGALAKVTRTEYEGSQPIYKVVVCQQLALYATATLGANLCGSSPATITGFTALSPSPFNLAPNPLPTSVANPRGHAALSGDTCQLMLDARSGEYYVSEVTLHSVPVMFSLRMNGDWLQAVYRTTYTEICDSVYTYNNLVLIRDFNYWCSGNYYCSGGGSGSGSGSGSGVTGGSCDCTTIASMLTVVFYCPGQCWHGGTVTITKSGSTWTGSGTVGGKTWTFTYNCSAGGGLLGGSLRVQGPTCLGGSAGGDSAEDQTPTIDVSGASPNSCNPVHAETVEREWLTTGHTGCGGSCGDQMIPYYIKFIITE